MLAAVELEVRHLRVLCAIADTGSVRAAARRLGVTQPSLTTQLGRIERAVGGPLFIRARTGCTPTPLGATVLTRARTVVSEMRALVSEARAALALDGEKRLRVGSTGNRAVAGWLRRLGERLPDTGTTVRVDLSPHTLLRLVADNHLDVACVHEVAGYPLQIPDGVRVRVLVDREPQFVALPADHPAAGLGEVPLTALAADRWMVDPAVDGEWAGLRRMFAEAGVDPEVVHGDYLTAADLVAAGQAVSPCQPTSRPRPGLVIRPLSGDPLAVRLLVATRATPATALDLDAVYADLEASYREVARASTPYRQWLLRRGSPLLATHAA
jgi:DNA-binding transcriptional LysR family regulator